MTVSITTPPRIASVDDDPCWRGFAEIYRTLEKAKPYQELVRTMAEAMRPQPGERWLDAGCGSGSMTEVIWSHTRGQCEIVAVDSSDVMLRHLRQRALTPPPSDSKIRLLKADLRCPLQLPSEHFNGVAGNLVFPYINSWHDGQTGLAALRCCFEEMCRVLKQGGRFVWSTPKENPNFTWIFLASWRAWIRPSIFRDAVKILGYAQELKRRWQQGHYHYLARSQLQRLMSQCGFVDTKFRVAYAKQGWVISGIRA